MSSDLTPKQYEIIGRMTSLPRTMETVVESMDELEPESLRAGTKLVREMADLLDELATELEGPNADAIRKAVQ